MAHCAMQFRFDHKRFNADPRFHFAALYRWMWIERVQQATAQFENMNARLRPAWDPKPCSLARWTRSICIQQNCAWKGIKGISIMPQIYNNNTRLQCACCACSWGTWLTRPLSWQQLVFIYTIQINNASLCKELSKYSVWKYLHKFPHSQLKRMMSVCTRLA